MHLRLWQRLFLVIAALSGLALAGFATWQQRDFRRGFIGYLDEVALERLQPAANRIAAAYAEHGSWDFLRGDERRFAMLIEPDPREAARREALPPPLPPTGPTGEAIVVPGAPPPRLVPPGIMARLQLVDADDLPIVGNAELPQRSPGIAITLDDVSIGTLRLGALPQLRGGADIAFAREQTRNALIAGAGVLAAALLLAFALARWMLEPVRALADGTRALAEGDYARRIASSRRDELGALAHDFNHLATTLEQHREARRRWGTDIAHELRTPLSILRGEIQALQDGVRSLTPQALASLHAECDRLGGLVEDLYQLALADAGALEYRFETLDLTELVRDALDMHRHALADAGLVLEHDLRDVPPVRGDARRLAQLVDNLLGNTLRYTDAPGRVRVSLAAASDRHVRLVVEDTPPGVPADALPQLFDRLFRVERSRNRAAGGAGLGLAICRAIVDAHEGRIEARASTLGGLAIAIHLPLQDAAP